MKKSFWKQKTGKSMADWARRIGVSREAVRVRFDKLLSLPDSEQIFSHMKQTGEYDYRSFPRKTHTSKHIRATGMTLLQLARHHRTYENNVVDWRQKAPHLTYEQWQARRPNIRMRRISIAQTLTTRQGEKV